MQVICIGLKTVFTFPFPHWFYIFWNLILDSVSKNYWENNNRVLRMEMEESVGNHDLNKENVEIPLKKAKHVKKSNKCNQCNFTSIQEGNLRRHLKIHSGGKSNKCNQCDFACSDQRSLSQRFIIHSAEKSNKCNQCDNASTVEKN